MRKQDPDCKSYIDHCVQHFAGSYCGMINNTKSRPSENHHIELEFVAKK